mmetsp:Transcript_13518/g.26796  ORF Transcript_13518/g.26796 Transcript_13518/m.26796 type:complete len:129 (+) Transcript_13518:280-666(+)
MSVFTACAPQTSNQSLCIPSIDRSNSSLCQGETKQQTRGDDETLKVRGSDSKERQRSGQDTRGKKPNMKEERICREEDLKRKKRKRKRKRKKERARRSTEGKSASVGREKDTNDAQTWRDGESSEASR